jgi:hypothetical protein
MAVPGLQEFSREHNIGVALAEIDAAIGHTQGAIAEVEEGSARRILYDAAIALDAVRFMLRNSSGSS